MKTITFQNVILCLTILSNQYLLNVHHVHDKTYSKEVTNTEYMTTAHEELTI